ncbi:hypothetical protein [Acidicapsa ligni]|uniref:hypothetical protein n=1 Tax=Acidicapsa ligni TaxID=542300 RepID=UPI0021E0DDDE|nr:hypothetical protein [Acidicapsa ligni]
MNPQTLNNGSHRERARELDPEAPKTMTDEKIARNIKSIIFAVLAVLGLGVLIAIWILHHRGQKIVPHVAQKQATHLRRIEPANPGQRLRNLA